MNYSDMTEMAKKGTTTVGVVCSDGIVLGSDSRATMGSFIANSEIIKVYKIYDNLGMTIAGLVGDAEYLVKFLKSQNEFYLMNEGKPLTPNSASSLLSLLMQQYKGMPFYVGLILGGLNRGSPELFNIDAYGGITKESKFTSTGSGSPVAIGYLEDNFKKDKTVMEAAKDVAKALKIAIKRDSATGDRVTVVTITKSGYREYTNEEVEKWFK